MKQKYTITIADVQMNIVTDETPEVVENLVGILDRRIREIYLQSGNRCPKTEAALLCALDYCAERTKMQETVSRLEAEIEKNEIEAVRAENAALVVEVGSLREQLSSAQAQYKDATADVGIASEQLRILTQKTVEAEATVDELKAQITALEDKLAEKDEEITRLTTALEEKPAIEAPVDELTKELSPEVTEEPEAEAIAAETPVEEAPVEEAPEAKETAEEAAQEKAPLIEFADPSLESFEIEMKPLRSNVDENQLTIDISVEAPVEKTEEKTKKAPEAPAYKDTKTLEKEKQKAQKRVRSMFDLITFDNV